MKILSKASCRPTVEAVFSASLPFYDKLTPTQQQLLVHNCSVASYFPYEVIHNNWERNYGFYLVTKGLIQGFALSPRGKEFCLFAITPQKTSSFFCDAIFITAEENIIDFRAKRETEVIYIPPDIWTELLSQSIEANHYSLYLAKQNISVIVRSLQAFMFLSVENKLAIHLWEIINIQRSTHPENLQENFIIHQTHEEIAFALGTSRESISRVLQSFKKKGLLTTHHGKIILTDYAALQKIIEEITESSGLV